MLADREYVKECDECVLRNFENKTWVIGPSFFQNRVKRLIDFIRKNRTKNSKILDIGSGGYMPLYLEATHACDLSAIAGDLLKKMGYLGNFTTASCDELPYGDKEFDIAICTEVIEHLTDMETVKKTMREIERVAKKWVITTPKASESGIRDKWNIEETHRQFMTEDDLVEIAGSLFPDLYAGGKIKLETVDHYVFIMRV